VHVAALERDGQDAQFNKFGVAAAPPILTK